MKKLFFIFNFSFLIFNFSSAQDSCSLRISLLTCSPGDELYSTFGHTALRVQDGTTGADYIFNYGTFEFAPDFYWKFIRGKLLYSLSVQTYPDFMQEYQIESRSVIEQALNLSCSEKEKLFTALRENAKEENRYYRYDFLFDNCTTRAKDIIAKNTSAPVAYKNILPAHVPTFRDLIHSYLDEGGEPWSKFGIDLLLGAKLDRKVTNEEAMFLPDYLLTGLDSAVTGNHPLVMKKQSILQMPSPISKNSLFTPFVIFSFLFVLIVVFSFIKSPIIQSVLKLFDVAFFLILGLAGLIMLFMWFCTDHKVTQNNYNLLWALPTNIVMAFFVYSKKNWVKTYFRIFLIINSLLLITWSFLPQNLNSGLIPIVFLIIFRSWNLSKSHAGKGN